MTTTHPSNVGIQRRTALLFATLALLCMAPWQMTGLAQGVEATAYTTVDSVSVGERFPLVLEVRHESAVLPLFPDSVAYGELSFGDIEILSVLSRGDRMVDVSYLDTRIDSIVFEAATFAIDTAVVAPIPVRLVAGSDTLTTSTEAFYIPVRSVLSPDASDIKDIAPLVEFPRSILPWLIGTLVATIVALLVAYLFRRFKPRPGPAPAPVTADAAPYDVAMKRLRDLEKAETDTEERVKHFYDELTDTLRAYLSETLHIHTLEETTREIVRDLRAKADPLVRQVDPEVPDRVKSVLEFADLVKFADYVPAAERNRETLTETRQTIDTVERGVRSRRREMETEGAPPA